MFGLAMTVALAVLDVGSADAQVAQIVTPGYSSAPSPLGITSPLGIGPIAPLGFTGIPLGATELPTPGLSPTLGGPNTSTASACPGQGAASESSLMAPDSTMSSNSAGAQGLSNLFTGSSMASPANAGVASSTCDTTSIGSFANPADSASSPTAMTTAPVGQLSIPLGATVLSAGGQSPELSTSTSASSAASASSSTSSSVARQTTTLPTPSATIVETAPVTSPTSIPSTTTSQ